MQIQRRRANKGLGSEKSCQVDRRDKRIKEQRITASGQLWRYLHLGSGRRGLPAGSSTGQQGRRRSSRWDGSVSPGEHRKLRERRSSGCWEAEAAFCPRLAEGFAPPPGTRHPAPGARNPEPGTRKSGLRSACVSFPPPGLCTALGAGSAARPPLARLFFQSWLWLSLSSPAPNPVTHTTLASPRFLPNNVKSPGQTSKETNVWSRSSPDSAIPKATWLYVRGGTRVTTPQPAALTPVRDFSGGALSPLQEGGQREVRKHSTHKDHGPGRKLQPHAGSA